LPVLQIGAQGSRSVSPLFAGRRDRSASPLFPTQRDRAEGSASPLFAGRREAVDEEIPAALAKEATPSEDDFPLFTNTSTAAPRSRSTSPLFANRQPAPVTRAITPPPPPPTTKPSLPPKVKEQEPILSDPVRDAAKVERSRDLGLLASFLGEEVAVAAKPTRGEWAGFDEEDDAEDGEDEFEGVQPLRIRGGKGDEDEDQDMEEASESDSDDSSSDSSDSDSDSDSDIDAEVKATTPYIATAASGAAAPEAASTPKAAPAKTQSVLKAMFAPAPATSSFLLGALDADIELDEELDIPLAPPPIKQTYEPAAALQPLAASKKSHFDPDSSIPLFFPTFGKGKDAMTQDTEADGYVGFWRQETDEEMKQIWENDKVELTRDWKKRYRDGKKQRKRRGGGNDAE